MSGLSDELQQHTSSAALRRASARAARRLASASASARSRASRSNFAASAASRSASARACAAAPILSRSASASFSRSIAIRRSSAARTRFSSSSACCLARAYMVDTFSISALHIAIKVPYFSNSGHKNEKVTSCLRFFVESLKFRCTEQTKLNRAN
eukprot:SAG31_NODE_7088_length_1792_cov_1.588895_2_plen_155_part_00